jgi:hypothetical protein
MKWLIAIALVVLLIVSIGAVHIYLTRNEIFDYDSSRIYSPPEHTRKTMLYVLGMGILAIVSAIGMLLVFFRI